MTTTGELDSVSALGASERFVEILCADEELVRAEFEAIIAAQRLEAPPSPPACAAALTRTPRPRGRHLEVSGAVQRERPRRAAPRGQRRQRSPPKRHHDQRHEQ